jgi:translation initiation factor 2 beta subunit (eIF-2beta)/eIF-5
VLQTSVAVESQGFSVVTHGRSEGTIKGEGTVLENRHLHAVADRLGKDRSAFIEYLSTVHTTKTAHELANVQLIDTPGLV